MSPQLLQSCSASALATWVESSGTRAAGHTLGVNPTTVGRWGDDLRAWPADALLLAAIHNDGVRTVSKLRSIRADYAAVAKGAAVFGRRVA